MSPKVSSAAALPFSFSRRNPHSPSHWIRSSRLALHFHATRSRKFHAEKVHVHTRPLHSTQVKCTQKCIRHTVSLSFPLATPHFDLFASLCNFSPVRSRSKEECAEQRWEEVGVERRKTSVAVSCPRKCTISAFPNSLRAPSPFAESHRIRVLSASNLTIAFPSVFFFK